MTLDELEILCDKQAQSPIGGDTLVLGIHRIARGDRMRVLPGVMGTILEGDRNRGETIVSVHISDVRMFIDRQRKREAKRVQSYS